MLESSPKAEAFSVLIVDQHPALARSIAHVLSSEIAQVQHASSLEEAREEVARHVPEVAVMGLEGADGLTLLLELLALDQAPELILHVESSASPVARWAARHHQQEVFEKPAQAEMLLDGILRLIRHRRGGPESVRVPVTNSGIARIIGEAPAIVALREQILRVAEFPTVSVLVSGETGTGKELVARAIHEVSSPDGPFVSVSCGAIPGSRFESELFGLDAGAFTGGRSQSPGLFGEASGGTIFLDEVGQLPEAIQTKLLRALETRCFLPVGARRAQPLRARIISGSNPMLSSARRTLPPDLYYRLAGFYMDTPPLREREEDLPILADHFLRAFCRLHGRPLMSLSAEAAEALRKHRWPGNIREFRAVIESAAVCTPENQLEAQHIREALSARGAPLSSRPDPREAAPETWSSQAEGQGLASPTMPGAPAPSLAVASSIGQQAGQSAADELPPRTVREGQTGRLASPEPGVASTSFPEGVPPSSGTALVGKRGLFETLPELEEFVISDVFRECQGNLSMAARTLGIPRSTLRDRLKKYGIELPASTRNKSS